MSVQEIAEGSPNLRAQFVEKISAAWHKSREKIIALGNVLIEARRALAHGEFTAMIERDLPFGPDNARRFMRIAADPRLSNDATSHVLPQSADGLDVLRRLSDEQFEQAIGQGSIHSDMTVNDARNIVRVLRSASPHAPKHREIAPPHAPDGSTATVGEASAHTYSEFVWLLAKRREHLGYSQLALDDRIGWAQGMTSHLETPHDPQNGRTAGPLILNEWLAGLQVGIQLVPDENRTKVSL